MPIVPARGNDEQETGNSEQTTKATAKLASANYVAAIGCMHGFSQWLLQQRSAGAAISQ